MSVTAREKTSELGLALEEGSRRTEGSRSSGAVYSRVRAERVFDGAVGEERMCEDEKSTKRGSKAKSSGE